MVDECVDVGNVCIRCDELWPCRERLMTLAIDVLPWLISPNAYTCVGCGVKLPAQTTDCDVCLFRAALAAAAPAAEAREPRQAADSRCNDFYLDEHGFRRWCKCKDVER